MLNFLKQLWLALTVDTGWKPEGDSEDRNWQRCKNEHYENERREADRRITNILVEKERRGGVDRRGTPSDGSAS